MSNAVGDALLLLADNFKRGGYYMQSIQCLRALCGSEVLLPATEVKVKLQLARLLLDHTYDVEHAKNELKTAHMLAATLPGNFCLRSEVLSVLSSCHKQLGNDQEQRDFLLCGLNVCQQAGHTSERGEVIQWQVYFHCRLAEVHLSQRDVGGALQWAEQGLQLATQYQLTQQQVLLLLCRLHLEMQLTGATAKAAATVVQLTQVMEQLQGTCPPNHSFLLQAKLNFNILQVLMQLREGHLQELAVLLPEDKSRLLVFHTMESLLKQLMNVQPAYDWLPYSALAATIHLLAANIIKPTGKVKLALTHVSAGEKFVDSLLQEIGLVSNDAGGAPLGPIMWSAGTPLLLKLLLLECKVQLQLLQTNFVGARTDLWRFAKMLHAYPFLKAQMGPSLHVLLGMYAHSLGSFQDAARHCQAAVDRGSGTMAKNAKTVATCLKVLASIEAGEAGAVSKALDSLDSDPEADLGLVELVVSQFTRSVIKVQQGKLPEAKALLGKALKLAHRKLCSHHLISTVLNMLAPLQLQDKDFAGGQQMGSSSYTLSRNNCDIPGLLNAFQVLHQTHTLEGQDASKLTSDQEYLDRKANELQAAVRAALDNGQQHQALMAWDLE